MSEYGQDQFIPDINTRSYETKKHRLRFAHPPLGGYGKPGKSVFKKYAKGKDGKYREQNEKKEEVAKKMNIAYTMGTWKKVGKKWKKIRAFGEMPKGHTYSGPQKAASAD